MPSECGLLNLQLTGTVWEDYVLAWYCLERVCVAEVCSFCNHSLLFYEVLNSYKQRLSTNFPEQHN